MRPTTGRAALLLAALLVLAGSGAASAATETTTASCTDEIVDGAGVLSAADVTMLTQGSAALAATTTLRLRTVTSVPKKDLNAYEKTLQISCGWADAANVRQPKLLVVMVDTKDRQMGIYPGPALSGTIDKPIWLSIEQHTMRPHLASADWEGGLQGGVYALAALINGGAVVASSPPVAAAATRKTHTIDYGQIGLWGGVMVLWAVVGLVGRHRKRRRWKQSSAYLYDNIPYGGGHHHGGWWGGGGGGGGSDGGGGGSSSDGGGGSSGF